MNCKDMLSYEEYKALCYSRNRKPLSYKDIGSQISLEDVKYKETKSKDLSKVFQSLSDEDMLITRNSLSRAVNKVKVELNNLFDIFDMLGCEFIDEHQFNELFNN